MNDKLTSAPSTQDQRLPRSVYPRRTDFGGYAGKLIPRVSAHIFSPTAKSLPLELLHNFVTVISCDIE